MAAADVSKARVERLEAMQNSGALVTADGMDRPTGWLVDNDFLVVFKQNRNGLVKRLHHEVVNQQRECFVTSRPSIFLPVARGGEMKIRCYPQA